jgi:hypothetical protein
MGASLPKDRSRVYSEPGPVASGKAEDPMTNQNERNTEKSEMRAMWIFAAVIVLLLVGGMGVNALLDHGASAGLTEQSGTVAPK